MTTKPTKQFSLRTCALGGTNLRRWQNRDIWTTAFCGWETGHGAAYNALNEAAVGDIIKDGDGSTWERVQ